MILVYIDETGNRGLTLKGEHDWLYSLTAVTLFYHRWQRFEKAINRTKRSLIGRISIREGVRLELADCEVKSHCLRIPKARSGHPFLGKLEDSELQELIGVFLDQLAEHNMSIFSVLVDKRMLEGYMDPEKLHRKTWELLLELIEKFMRARHHKHQAIMICDDSSKQLNRSLAMKHAYLMEAGTKTDTWLRHICEMPMFVRSELSNGVQLADLCSYNIYRAFSRGDLSYPFFQRIAPFIWSRSSNAGGIQPFSGLYIMPGQATTLRNLVTDFEEGGASARGTEAPKMASSGANPIEPTCGTGRSGATEAPSGESEKRGADVNESSR